MEHLLSRERFEYWWLDAGCKANPCFWHPAADALCFLQKQLTDPGLPGQDVLSSYPLAVKSKTPRNVVFFGGPAGTRTPDPLLAKQVL